MSVLDTGNIAMLYAKPQLSFLWGKTKFELFICLDIDAYIHLDRNDEQSEMYLCWYFQWINLMEIKTDNSWKAEILKKVTSGSEEGVRKYSLEVEMGGKNNMHPTLALSCI